MVRNSAGDRGSLLIRGMESPISSHLTYRWYPRSRGVYAAVLRALSWAVGSSPLARGLLEHTPTGTVRARIIPARAGFTRASPRGSRPGADHPRSRGVYACHTSRSRSPPGSSPLARGLHIECAVLDAHRGIIPARAGFTRCSRGTSSGRPDHPRSRGVYARRVSPSQPITGSSPLARGLHISPNFTTFGTRIIPARAGFTQLLSERMHHERDHPRSRGVYAGWMLGKSLRMGSSPLARGLLRHSAGYRSADGIIPARAGFTAAFCWLSER